MATTAALVTIEMLKKNVDLKITRRAYVCRVLKKKLYVIPITLIKNTTIHTSLEICTILFRDN